MNTDLISKLIKLANNNPNEHEANLAARKVCQMLTGHFDPKPKPKVTTWNDVQRSPEPEFKSKPQTASQQNPYTRPPNEPPPVYNRPPNVDYDFSFFNEFFKTRTRQWNNFGERPPKEVKIPNHYYQPYTPPSKQKEERDLKCKTCGKIIKTKFVGLAEVFECSTCQWTAYEKQTNKMEK